MSYVAATGVGVIRSCRTPLLSDPRLIGSLQPTGVISAAPRLQEHLRTQFRNFYYHVGRKIGSASGDADRLGIGRLVEAIGLTLVRAQERTELSIPGGWRFANGGLRRNPVVAARSDEGLLTEPTAGVRPW